MKKSQNHLNKAEAQAFDERMRERIEHGLLPDLRLVKPCDWFYNNPWRRPKFINIIYGKYLEFAISNLPGSGCEVFEVGSGLGHMALELARTGYKVTGIELSPYSVEVANKVALDDPFERGSGTLYYENTDFFDWEPGKRFDGACFFQTLHHFENVDEVLDKVISLLNPGGRIIVIEPARDWFSFDNALFIAAVRIILSHYDGWYEKLDVPTNQFSMDDYINDVYDEYQQARDKGENEQSPLDNSIYATKMLDALRAQFKESAFRTGFSFLPRMIGGIRGKTGPVDELVDFLCLLDDYCVTRGILSPGVFYFAGESVS